MTLEEVQSWKYLRHVKIEIGGCIDAVASHMRYVTEVFLLNREYIR